MAKHRVNLIITNGKNERESICQYIAKKKGKSDIIVVDSKETVRCMEEHLIDKSITLESSEPFTVTVIERYLGLYLYGEDSRNEINYYSHEVK